jgi:hypothetical protein
MNVQHRRIFKRDHVGVSILGELLQSMFVGELLQTGQDIWLVSPWISDVPLIDNRTGNFDSLYPEWGKKDIRLKEILLTFMSKGCRVNIVCRPNEPSNIPFINRLKEIVNQNFLDEFLNIKYQSKEHTKGILLSNSLLTGSMNITWNGLKINGESIQFSIDPEEIARTRIEFSSEYERKWR